MHANMQRSATECLNQIFLSTGMPEHVAILQICRRFQILLIRCFIFSPYWAYSIVNGLPMNLLNGDPCAKHFSGQLFLLPSKF